MPKNKKLALNSGIQSYQILTNDDEVCIPSLSSILLAVCSTHLLSLVAEGIRTCTRVSSHTRKTQVTKLTGFGSKINTDDSGYLSGSLLGFSL